jgi:FkbH-like protein
MLSFKELKQNIKKDVSDLPVVKVALLGDTATQFLADALRGNAIEHSYKLDLFEAEYNQIERQILDPDSELYAFDAEYIIVFQSTHKLLAKYSGLSLEKQINLASDRLGFVEQIVNLFNGQKREVNTRIVYFNYPEIDDGIFGSFAGKLEHSFVWQIRKLNYELMCFASCHPNFFICDLASIQNKLGRDLLFDASIYISTEMILSLDCLPSVSSRVIDIISAIRGQFKKCLILDLDNTLWGGIIGDDGIENIQIGHGLGIGKAFTEFQQWIKKLKERGIILAVCSKNNEDTAKEPFQKHPEMVLKLDDISVFAANWESKIDNIRYIQSILNIGFDSMVFLDDNPVERAIVRENIPGIAVPELPEDPADYLEYLYFLNLFETASFSLIDSERTKQYQIEAERVIFQKSFANEADFLKSLEMVSEVKGFDSFNIPRIAQLTQRSNQFNLRTIRYTEEDILHLANDKNYQNFVFTLSDKFGENGIICIIVLEKQNQETLFINTWLMSCRVLKRGMEYFTLNTIVNFARENGFRNIIGEYIPSVKNKIVGNHFVNLGFAHFENNDERSLFILDVDTYQEKVCFIKSYKGEK